MRRRTAALALLCVLVAASGCAGLSGDPTSTSTETNRSVGAATVQERALAAMRNISTYEYTLRGTQRLSGLTVRYDSTGVVNRTAERLRVETTATVERGDRSNTATSVTYIVGDTSYVESQGTWRTRPLERGTWSRNALGRQRAILASANVTYRNTTTVAGVETYALVVQPSTESLENYVRNRSDVPGDVSVDDVHVVQYVATETHRLRKVTMEMSLTVNGQSLHQSFVVTFANYGVEANVTVPDAAT